MSSYGFVYILHNPQMLCIKIGCTERAPHARAEELSRSTGVPVPFRVLCYVEVDDFQRFERLMHEWCKQYRVADNREFFSEDGVTWAVSLMLHSPATSAFCMVDPEYLKYQHDIRDLADLDNPFKKPEPKAANPAAFDPAIDYTEAVIVSVTEQV